MTLGKNEQHGRSGEDRTSSFLLDGEFAVLKRIPDVDGADFLVQLPFRDIQELRERTNRIETFGIVQSKFFEGTNEVTVRAAYVTDETGPRPEFFVLVHTLDDSGRPVMYFFTAAEIVSQWRHRGGFYAFSVTKDRDFASARDRAPRDIWNVMVTAIRETQEARNWEFINRVATRWANTPPESKPFKSEHGIWMTRDSATGTERPITEPSGDGSGQDYDPTTDTWTTR